jgi:hypothetical protein
LLWSSTRRDLNRQSSLTDGRTSFFDRGLLRSAEESAWVPQPDIAHARLDRGEPQIGGHRTVAAQQSSPSILVFGKGRRERGLPLEGNRSRHACLACGTRKATGDGAVRHEQGMAMTRAGFEFILKKHAKAAAAGCSTLIGRTLSPHLLRHGCAVLMLQATATSARSRSGLATPISAPPKYTCG